ncbi:MAG: ABC transporter ATP-binding protein [Cellulosilyticaceae bacterium]
MFGKFISFYKPYKKLFILDLLVAFIASACGLVYPMLTQQLIDQSIPKKDIEMIFRFAVILIVIYLVKLGCNYFMQYWGHVVGVRMQADMRRQLFTHLQKLPVTYFDNTKTGEIMSRMINDLMEISELAHHGPEDLFISAVMLIGSFIILIGVNVPLTLIIFAFVPFIFLFTWKKRTKMKQTFHATRVKTGEVNALLENSIAGIRVSKSFGSFDHDQEKFEKGNQSFTSAREVAYKTMAEYFSGATFAIDLLDFVSLIAGGIFTYKGLITLGEFMAFMLYIKMFTAPITKLVNFMEQYQNGMTGFNRYLEIMNELPEVEPTEGKVLAQVQGHIAFEKVSFKYEDEYVLKDLDLNVGAGQMVALVGPSGGGKTTLCNLIPRFYDVAEGQIKLDGTPITDLTLENLRSHIGIVQQEVFLFTGTIKENILYGNHQATEEEVIEAAKRANIHEFIMGLADGYETYIGERGVKLSGGQKQRLSIARVFLKNPSLLILDEATSALDNATEYMIQQSIEEVCKNRTTLVVAHRLSTVRKADQIIVLGENGIEEQGTHQELLAKQGIYQKLYEAQFEGLEIQ